MKKIKLLRVNMNLPQPLVEKVKEYAQKNYTNFTTAYVMLLNSALNTERALQDASELVKFVNNNQALMKMKGNEEQ